MCIWIYIFLSRFIIIKPKLFYIVEFESWKWEFKLFSNLTDDTDAGWGYVISKFIEAV